MGCGMGRDVGAVWGAVWEETWVRYGVRQAPRLCMFVHEREARGMCSGCAKCRSCLCACVTGKNLQPTVRILLYPGANRLLKC